MYRDLIGEPEKIEANGCEWWMQTFCRWDGTIKAVVLYDADGEKVGEFPGTREAEQFILGAK